LQNLILLGGEKVKNKFLIEGEEANGFRLFDKAAFFFDPLLIENLIIKF
jgi:hypothetical protein